MGYGLIHLSVFLISFSILSYEIVFTRIIAWAQWVNLSSLVITMALLGFGISGSVVSVFSNKIKKHFCFIFSAGLICFPIFLTLGFIITSFLSLNPYELAFNPKQILGMFCYFFVMGACFFFGAVIICTAFLNYRVSTLYFYNLLGSGAGVLAVAAVSFYFHPVYIMVIIILVAMVPALALVFQTKKMGVIFAGCFTAISLILLCWSTAVTGKGKVSEYKAISGALSLPDAKVVHTAYSPLAVIDVVEADGLRTTAGLSLVSPYQVPVQKGIFFNAGAMSPITPYAGDPDEIKYIEYLSSYLPFYVIEKKHRDQVLIIGSGGGESILKSILSQFNQIDALEVDANIISLMTKEFASFSGHVFKKMNVRVINQEARSYIRQTQKKYDLIELSMIDAYNTSASGVHSLNESYLYTIESITEYLKHLKNYGLLAITRWMVTPARDNLKIFNMMIQAMHQMGISDPGKHLIAIRSLQTITLMASVTPIQEQMIEHAKIFSKNRLFDLVYYPGILEKEINQYIELNPPVYSIALKTLLSSHAKNFIKSYTFDISASTDNKPYFYNFFKPSVIPAIKMYGPSQIPVTELGYLILILVLIPVFITAFIFILIPIRFVEKDGTKKKRYILVYFSLIGTAYFFIEMPLIQKMGLFLGHPAYSFSVIIAGLLISSGMGSLFSDRLFPVRKSVFTACVFIVTIMVFYIFFMDRVLFTFIEKPVEIKIFITLFFLFPLGFFMGIPFPCALSSLKKDHASLSWAWGINGFSGVVSILSAALFAILLGFDFVMAVAMICYAAAGCLSLKYF